MSKTNHPQPTFRTTKINRNEYWVHFSGLVLGTVRKNEYGVWVTVHRDGTEGPGAWTRIDAAWALINS